MEHFNHYVDIHFVLYDYGFVYHNGVNYDSNHNDFRLHFRYLYHGLHHGNYNHDLYRANHNHVDLHILDQLSLLCHN